VDEWLHDTFRPEYRVRIQLPFECPDESEPEPDAAVVTREQMARLPHPNQALLVIEISDSSVEEDREMAFDYASAQVPDYWLLNMRDRQIEVYWVTDTPFTVFFSKPMLFPRWLGPIFRSRWPRC
jgi:Uma2 family endonuclease